MERREASQRHIRKGCSIGLVPVRDLGQGAASVTALFLRVLKGDAL